MFESQLDPRLFLWIYFSLSQPKNIIHEHLLAVITRITPSLSSYTLCGDLLEVEDDEI